MLADKLKAKVEQSAAIIPAEAKTIMSEATAILNDTLPTRQVPKTGDPLPTFELPDSRGQLIKSADLIKESQLIITLFRGAW